MHGAWELIMRLLYVQNKYKKYTRKMYKFYDDLLNGITWSCRSCCNICYASFSIVEYFFKRKDNFIGTPLLFLVKDDQSQLQSTSAGRSHECVVRIYYYLFTTRRSYKSLGYSTLHLCMSVCTLNIVVLYIL